MARNARRTRVSRGTGARRTWVWVRHTATSAMPTGTGTFANLFSEFESTYGAQLLGTTVMRIRGEIKTDQSVTAAARVWSEPLGGVAGMTSADDGPGAVPWQDWFLYEPIFLDVTTGVRVKEIDNRASRKIEELQQGLLLAITNNSGSTANVSWDLSIGVKLP